MRSNSLSRRLMIAVICFSAATTAAISVLAWLSARSVVEERLSESGRMLLQAMASDAGGYLGQYDYFYLRNYVTQMTGRSNGIAYAVVVENDGNVVAHSNHALEGKSWKVLGGPDPRDAGTVVSRRTSVKGRRILEMTTPVMIAGKFWGTVQLGFDYDHATAGLKPLAMKIGIAGVAVIALAVAGIRPFTRTLTSGLTRLVASTREIADGDLRTRLPEDGYEEISALAHSFNVMSENLHEAVSRIQETGSAVQEFSSGVIVSVQEHAAGASQQAASIGEATATLEELNGSARRISENAAAVRDSAIATLEMARNGNGLMNDGVKAMGELKAHVEVIKQKNQFLWEKSGEIGTVMELVGEIAGGVHLMALNAAIESAGAGVYGLRFAAVASEIRRLSTKSRTSLETITGILSEIQAAAEHSINAVQEGSEKAEMGLGTIRSSAATFEGIIRGIENTSDATTRISTLTDQQTAGNDLLFRAMQDISGTVRTSAQQMGESSRAALALKTTVEQLQETTAQFKL